MFCCLVCFNDKTRRGNAARFQTLYTITNISNCIVLFEKQKKLHRVAVIAGRRNYSRAARSRNSERNVQGSSRDFLVDRRCFVDSRLATILRSKCSRQNAYGEIDCLVFNSKNNLRGSIIKKLMSERQFSLQKEIQKSELERSSPSTKNKPMVRLGSRMRANPASAG